MAGEARTPSTGEESILACPTPTLKYMGSQREAYTIFPLLTKKKKKKNCLQEIDFPAKKPQFFFTVSVNTRTF